MCNDEKKENRTERKNEEKNASAVHRKSERHQYSPFVSSEETVKTAPPLTCCGKIDLEEGTLMRGGRRTACEHGLESLIVPLLSHAIRLLSSSRHL